MAPLRVLAIQSLILSLVLGPSASNHANGPIVKEGAFGRVDEDTQVPSLLATGGQEEGVDSSDRVYEEGEEEGYEDNEFKSNDDDDDHDDNLLRSASRAPRHGGDSAEDNDTHSEGRNLPVDFVVASKAPACPKILLDAIAVDQANTVKDILVTDEGLQNCKTQFEVVGWNLRKDQVKGTAIHYAANLGLGGVIQVLLQQGFDVNALTKKSYENCWRGGDTALSYAAFRGYVEVVQILLKSPEIQVNVRRQDGSTALGLAAFNGNTQVMKLLLQRPEIEINVQAQDGRTALAMAAQYDQAKATSLLLEAKGVQVNLPNRDGLTPLMLAILRRSLEALGILLGDSNVDINVQDKSLKTALIRAVCLGLYQATRLLLGRADINPNLQDKNTMTALMYTIFRRENEAVRILLEHPNIDPNVQDQFGRSALIYAAKYGRITALEMLLGARGLQANLVNLDGQTALIVAVRSEHMEAVRLLLGVDNIDPDVQDKDQLSALMYAVQRRLGTAIELLLGMPGLYLDLPDKIGRSAVMKAAENGYTEGVVLLDPRSDPNKIDLVGRTALMLAAQQGHAEVVRLLLKNVKRKVDQISQEGTTALKLAVSNSRVQVVKELVNAGGNNVNTVYQDGFSVLMYAAKLGELKVLTELLLMPDLQLDLQNQDGMTAVMFAAKGNHWKAMHHLLQASSAGIDLQNKEKMSALMLAAESGSSAVVAMFVVYEADATLKREDGNNALMLAAGKGHAEVVKHLSWLPDVDVNARNKAGCTALMIAAKRDYPQVVRLLMRHFDDLDLDIRNKDGVNALVLAAENSYESAVSFLDNLQAEGDSRPNVTEEARKAILDGFMQAAEGGYEQAFGNFLKFGDLQVESVNQAGDNALMRAVLGGRIEMVRKVLGEHGHELAGHKNEAGWSLLHFAVNSRHQPVEMVKFVLENGSPETLLNSISDAGLTPLQMAVEMENIDLVRELLSRQASIRHDKQGKSSALRLALGAGNYIITKMLLKAGAAVDWDIEKDDDEGKHLAIWLGVELSESQLVEHFCEYEQSWAEMWIPPLECSGDMKGACTGGLLERAKTKTMVHRLLDWQDRVDGASPHLSKEESEDKYDRRVSNAAKKVRMDALTASLKARKSEATLALLSRGVGEEWPGRPAKYTIPKDVEFHPDIPVGKLKVWNRLHWSAFSCDSDTLALGLKYPTEVLVEFLDDSPAGPSDTVFDVGKCDGSRFPRVVSILKQSRVLLSTWKVKVRNDMVSGILTGLACISALVFHLFFLRLQTLQQRYWWFIMITPLWFCLAGWLLVVTANTNEGVPRSAAVQKIVGWVAVTIGAITFSAVCATFVSPSYREHLSHLKRRGNVKLDRCWEKLDCGMSWTLCVVLLLKEVTTSGRGGALFSGLVQAVASTLPLILPSPRRTAMLLRLLPGTVVAAYYVHQAITGKSLAASNCDDCSPTAPPSPQTILLIATCFALAWADMPGSCPSLKRRFRPSKVVEIEIEMMEKANAADIAASSKFTANKIVFGRAELAAHGIERALGLTPEQIAEGLKDPIEAMRREVETAGDKNDIENFAYIVDGISGRPEDYPSAVAGSLRAGLYHGGFLGPDDFDTGHEGRSLADWMQVKEVVLANLTQAEFVAVRFYTSSSFAKINMPLRQKAHALSDDNMGSKAEPHPWAMVVYLLDKGIKKLRSVQAQVDPEAFARQTILWRGMKNVAVDMQRFHKHGGTEMAPMSTTTNEEVARHYAASKVPLVFKYMVGGMKTGVSIRFLSLYPKEEEFLYAPLTYLTLRNQYEDDGTTILVVEPVMS